MRKTPLSAPGGSYGRKNNYDWNSRDRHQQHGYDDRPGSGYGHNFQFDDNKPTNFSPGHGQSNSPQKTGDDFIPLGSSSPINHRPRFNSPNWRGHGNPHRHRGTPPSAGGGFNNSYRHNSYHDTPRSSFNDSKSPQFYQKNRFAQRRPHQRGAHRHVDISNYLNVKAILEDPWADLVKNLEKRNPEIGIKAETPSCDSPCGSNLAEDFTVKPNSPKLDSASPESQITDNDQKPETTATATTAS